MTLCSFHHTLVHEGGFSIARTASGDIACFTHSGRRIEAAAPTMHGDVHAIFETNSALGLDVSAETCDSKWDGLPADYDLVLTAFFSRPDVVVAYVQPVG